MLTARAPLTWGQRHISAGRSAAEAASDTCIAITVRVADANPQRQRDAIRDLQRRHETLRTVFDAGLTEQHVHGADSSLGIQELPERDEEGPDPSVHFDPTEPYPWAFQTDDARRTIRLFAHHLLVDRFSLEILARDLRQIIDGRSLPSVELTPANLALFEQREGSLRAERYWRARTAMDAASLRDAAPFRRMMGKTIRTRFPDLDDSGSVRPPGQTPTAWIAGAFLRAAAKLDGSETAAVGLVGSNRTTRRLRGVVGTIAQPVLISARAETTADDINRKVISSLQHGSYDPVILDSVADATGVNLRAALGRYQITVLADLHGGTGRYPVWPNTNAIASTSRLGGAVDVTVFAKPKFATSVTSFRFIQPKEICNMLHYELQNDSGRSAD